MFKSKKMQILLQILFLGFFVFLTVRGDVRVWLLVFAALFLLSLVFSRFYCGYVCPINTVMKPVSFLKRKFGKKGASIPRFMKRPIVRYGFLVVVIGFMVFSAVTGRELPVLPVLIGLGFVMTVFFPEQFFHRHLCPFGAMLKLPGKASCMAVRIEPKDCTNCGVCARVCPSGAAHEATDVHEIAKDECLVCMECVRACPVKTIRYQMDKS